MSIEANAVSLGESIGAPVFLLSCERSGSTLLRFLIDTHSQICSPGELMLGSLCSDLLAVLTRTVGQLPRADEKNEKNIAIEEARRIVSGIMDTYTFAKGKKLWCEKTPSNLMHLASLHAVFPEARYICLYRNCLDVVHSCLEMGKNGFITELAPYVARNPQNLVAAMIDSWSEKTTQLMQFEAKNPSKCHSIKYESLVHHPSETLQELFRFLQVPWEPDILNRVFTVHHDIGGGDSKIEFTKKIDPQSVGKGSAISFNQIPEEHLRKMNDILAHLGYPTVAADWNTRPSPYRQDQVAKDIAAARLTVRDVFQSLVPKKLKQNNGLLGPNKVSLKFAVTGNEAAFWLVKLDGQRSHVIEGDQVADCVITVQDEVLLDIVSEKINAAVAYWDGKIKIQGNVDLISAKLGLLF